MQPEDVPLNPFDPFYFPFHVVYAVVFGALFGSFYNVVIWRNPRRYSIVFPGSHCTVCGTPIKWYDNLPIFSWLLLGGGCRRCGSTFSFRYAGIELLTAALFVLVFLQFQYSLSLFLYLGFVSLLVIATFTDIDHFIIPDWINFGGLCVGLIVALFAPWMGDAYLLTGEWQPFEGHWWQGIAAALIGAAVGYGILQGIAVLGKLLFRKEAMGQGDVWLVTMFGAIIGWQGAVSSLVLACFLGSVISGAGIVIAKIRQRMRGGALPDIPGELPAQIDPSTQVGFEKAVEHFDLHRKERKISHHLPFGPYLCAGALLTLFFWEWIMTTMHEFYFAPLRDLGSGMP